MPVAANKALARRFVEEVWNAGRLDAAEALLADDLITHRGDGGTLTGRAAFVRFIADFRADYPGLRFAVEDVLGEGEEVATRVAVRGSHAGRAVEWTGIGIVRIAGGRIAEQWANTDLVESARQQTGAGPG